jgi:hypothetical protein
LKDGRISGRIASFVNKNITNYTMKRPDSSVFDSANDLPLALLFDNAAAILVSRG